MDSREVNTTYHQLRDRLRDGWRLQALKTVLPVLLTLVLLISAIYLIALPSMKRIALDAKKEMITELGRTAYHLLEEYEARAVEGEFSDVEARARAVERIGSLRYGSEGEDYFWINDIDHMMIMHPYRSDLEGTNVRDFEDPNGKRLFVHFVETVKDGGEGYVDYWWQWKSDSTRVVPKYSYVKLFEPWGWIIGTGIYIEDVYAEIDLITRRINIAFLIIIFFVLLLSLYMIFESRALEKKRSIAEESLMASEKKFRSISSSAMDAIIMMDERGRITFWNAAAENIFGYDASEVNGKRLHDLIMPTLEGYDHEEMIARLNDTGESKMFGDVVELEAKHRKGHSLPVEMTVSPVKMDGRLHTVGIVRDLSLKKEAERQLRESRERWLLHIHNTPLGFIEWDIDFRVIEWNPAAERIFGYKREEVLGVRAEDIIVPDEVKPQVDAIWLALLQQAGGSRSLNRNVTKSGETILCDWYNTVLVDSGGKVIGVASLVEDITALKSAEESVHRQSAALEQAMDGVAIIGLDGRIQFVNASWARMHRYSASEIVGRHFSEDHTESQIKNELDPLLKILEKTGEAQGEVGHSRKDGTEFPANMSLRILRDAEGDPVGRLATIQDISERKKLEAQLLQAQKVESIGRLAGGIAHDFNNLLSPILGYSEMLLEDFSPDDPRYSDIDEIKSAAERARDLTRQLLAFGRKQVLEFRIVDLNEIVSSFESILRRTIREDIGLEIRLSAAALNIRVDVTQVEMILMNLAVNAVDSMSEGGRLIVETNRVTLDSGVRNAETPLDPGEYVTLSISDTGAGMDEETMKHVFEPFFTTKAQGQGTGLGLSTVYGIVQQHKGHIWLYSEENIGTTFRIYLPLMDKPDHVASRRESVDKATHRGSETILVVEDNLIVRNLVSKLLTRQGYEVVSFSDPMDCVQSIPAVEKEIDMLLTDVVMPGMNGKELYDKLSIWMPGLKVLYMSGYTDDVIVHRGIIDDGVNYIQKPFTNNDLTVLIRRILDSDGKGDADKSKASTLENQS